MNFQFAEIENIRPFKPYKYDPEPSEWQVMDQVNWDKTIIIEIGCGKGTWITEQAKKNAGKHYIGIERTENKSKTLLNKANKSKLKNLIAIQADANALIHQKVPKKTVDELYFFYPNPTPKKRQANQRFFVGSSFHVYNNCLKPNGQIYLVSNIKDYVWEAKQFLEKIWEYEILFSREITEKIPPRTEFEKKYLKAGETLFELKAIKAA